ncbi:hypothetical protein GCM10023333_16180 [Ferrimonas pelagia]|uniref:DUF2132 domain-containing protein n=2 Tax=Ferrimonas pelagia TaxID=1177826 RepID=A0ABP9EPT7_9GAMM
MTDKINYENNPLHGLSLQDMLTQVVDQYGFELLDAYLNIHCFKNRPTIESSLKFLKKTEWARHKLEVFYLYTFKSLPRPSSEQFALPPRDRIVPDHHKIGEPKALSFEDAEEQRKKREEKAQSHQKNGGFRQGGKGSGKGYSGARGASYGSRDGDKKRGKSSSRGETSASASKASDDPWINWR